MKVDQTGIDFIKSFESLSLSPYLDQAGIWTQGWGHRYGICASSPTWTRDEAENVFESDLRSCQRAIVGLLNIDLSQNEFNALASWTFNLGVSRLKSSTLLRRINSGDIQGAGKEILKWNKYHDPHTGLLEVSSGLSRRRELESALFLRDLLYKKAIIEA